MNFRPTPKNHWLQFWFPKVFSMEPENGTLEIPVETIMVTLAKTNSGNPKMKVYGSDDFPFHFGVISGSKCSFSGV